VSQQSEQDEISQMDDFEVIRERQKVMAALRELTDRYRRLNTEMTTRETLRWMAAP
jgi:3-methyladenine DNA glycosylase Tag